jgi:glutamine amidotransferase
MCELLGMSFNLPVRPKVSFRGFRHRGETNPDGWGIAFYPDKSTQVIKEPIRAKSSSLSDFLKDYQEVRSKVIVGHVRRASAGNLSHRNTHPFCRELNGKEYILAHNGTLRGYNDLRLGRFEPIGETDSEHAFCHLLGYLAERNTTNWNVEKFEWLARKLKDINSYGDFNCIFSDGQFLFCYHDYQGYNGLCFVLRKPPYDRIQLADEDWKINLAVEKNPEQTGFIIASRSLTDEPWINFDYGELIVFKSGKMIYSNSRDVLAFQGTSLKEDELKILRVVRNSLQRLSLAEIINETQYSAEEVKSFMHELLSKGYIKQDSRDTVKWSNNGATFYTVKSKRDEIDTMIGNIS